jgi:hypothetical protein
VLGGCGTVIIIGAIAAAVLGYFAYRKTQEFASDLEKNPAMTVARMVVAANPDVEMVSIDEAKGIIVVKDKKTGKQLTVNLEDARNGKFVFQEDGKEAVTIEARGEGESGTVELKSDQGTMKLGAGSDASLPAWLPAYPGATSQGNYSMKTKDGDSGSFNFKTSDSLEKVVAFYESELRAVGLTVNTTTWKAAGVVVGGAVTADERSSNRTASVTLSSENGVTQVNVVFATKQ